MEKLTLSQIASAVGGCCQSGKEVLAVCTDTRKIEPGSLFIAIKGERFDGHDFIAQAFEKGAVGAIADHPVAGFENIIVVADTRRALLDRSGVGIKSSTAAISSWMQVYSGAFGSVEEDSRTCKAEPRMIGVSSPGKSYSLSSSRTSISTRSRSSSSST